MSLDPKMFSVVEISVASWLIVYVECKSFLDLIQLPSIDSRTFILKSVLHIPLI